MIDWILEGRWYWLAALALSLLCGALLVVIAMHDTECDCCCRPWAIFTRRHPGMAIPLRVCRRCAKHLDRRARVRVVH